MVQACCTIEEEDEEEEEEELAFLRPAAFLCPDMATKEEKNNKDEKNKQGGEEQEAENVEHINGVQSPESQPVIKQKTKSILKQEASAKVHAEKKWRHVCQEKVKHAEDRQVHQHVVTEQVVCDQDRLDYLQTPLTSDEEFAWALSKQMKWSEDPDIPENDDSDLLFRKFVQERRKDREHQDKQELVAAMEAKVESCFGRCTSQIKEETIRRLRLQEDAPLREIQQVRDLMTEVMMEVDFESDFEASDCGVRWRSIQVYLESKGCHTLKKSGIIVQLHAEEIYSLIQYRLQQIVKQGMLEEEPSMRAIGDLITNLLRNRTTVELMQDMEEDATFAEICGASLQRLDVSAKTKQVHMTTRRLLALRQKQWQDDNKELVALNRSHCQPHEEAGTVTMTHIQDELCRKGTILDLKAIRETLSESSEFGLEQSHTGEHHSEQEVVVISHVEFHAPVVIWESDNVMLTKQEKSEPHNDRYSGNSWVLHTTTKIPGMEGPIVDTGAVGNLTGADAVKRLSQIAQSHNKEVRFEKLKNPKYVSGVGDNAKPCEYQVIIPGMLENGKEIEYSAAMISGNPSPLPPLYGLDSMSETNTYFSAKHGTMFMVPEGKDPMIIWPQGTERIQCAKAPSGHWILVTNHWDRQ